MKKEVRKKIETKKISVNLKKKDDFFMIVFAVLGIALIVAFYLYLKNLR